MSDNIDPTEQEDKAEKKRLKAEKNAAELRISQAKAEEAEVKLQRTKERLELEKLNTEGTFGTPSEPRKAMSTYLRNQNKFEVSAISILDKKAAILIKICSTFVSVLIGFSSYIDENVANGSLLSIILTVGLTASLILAILSAKPFILRIERLVMAKILPTHPSLEENSFLLRKECTIEEYELAMQKVVQQQDLQLGNQIRANYLLANVNSRKSILVDYAYSVFLITFVLTGAVFLLNKAGMI